LVLLLFDLGSGEIFLIVLAIFLVFGPGKIPELARGLGKFINEIKRASEDVKTEINREADRIDREKKRDTYMKQKEPEEKQPEEKQNVKTEKIKSKPKTATSSAKKPRQKTASKTASPRKRPVKKADVDVKPKAKSKSARTTKKKTNIKAAKQAETVTNEIKIKPAEKSVRTKR